MNGEFSFGARERALELEARWQSAWLASGVFRRRRPERAKWYVLELPPFATGNLHLGHARNYVMADVSARFRRMAGFDVLYTTGYDTFGLPSEHAAREAGVHPAELADTCCAQMGRQLRALGLSHDDHRIMAYHEPRYYKWIQWVFLRLWEAGHCTRREEPVLWCHNCNASVTESLVEDGCCWRCHSLISIKRCTQWFITESHFAEAMLANIETLSGWPANVRRIHADWIGKRTGWRVELAVEGRAETVAILVENRMDLAEAVALGIHEDHKLFERGGQLHAIWPGSRPIPVIGVDGRALPGGDLCEGSLGMPLVPGRTAAHDRILEDHGLLGAPSAGGTPAEGLPATVYRLKDWCIARQRYWGPPVPVIYCTACGPQPVPEAELPVLLPLDVDLTAPGNPLESHASFLRAQCPSCFGPATRETDTFEAYSSPWWYHWLPLEPDKQINPFDFTTAARWLPVDLMIGGSDQVRSCFFHVRMIAKALNALGLSDVEEPVANLLPIGMFQSDGVKMSKRIRNSASLDILVGRHGGDAVRFAVLSAGAPERNVNWSETLIQKAEGFLAAAWRLADSPLLATTNATDAPAAEGASLRARLAGWMATAVYKITRNLLRNEFHLMVRNLEFLLERLQRFERATSAADASAFHEAWEVFLRLLAPTAPHLAEELWARLGNAPFLAEVQWPALVPKAASPEIPQMPGEVA